MLANVDPQPAGAPMIVTTPHARMTVMGTKFSVSALADRTRLLVNEGKIRMQPANTDGAEQDVTSGGVAVVKQGSTDVARPGKIRKKLDVKDWGLGTPQGVAFDGKLVWLYMMESATLAAMDPDTLKMVKQVKVEQLFPEHRMGASGLAWDGKLLWGWGRPGVLRAVDPETGKTVRDIKLPKTGGNEPFDIHDGVLFVTTQFWKESTKSLLKLDLKTGDTLAKMKMDDSQLNIRTADSMCCGPGIAFVMLRRSGGIVAAHCDDGQLLYRCEAKAGSEGFFGGDAAYDPQRGLWTCTGKTRILLVEAE